ncbi:MAG: FIVAR domain-containing protein [Acetobacteraceae bacterium]|nr:FIVAR domain-containing protein [Acetobacteraceae bacterium]
MAQLKHSFCILLFGALSMAGVAASSADLKSPDMVKMGLRILAGVYGDMDRKLAANQYDRLPHENEEFQEGSGALRDAVANEPSAFKTKSKAALDEALANANRVAEASKSHDKAQVQAALHALAQSLTKLNALFPESLRAEPGTVAPGRPGAGPNPPP